MTAQNPGQRQSQWPLGVTLLVLVAGLVMLTFYDWRNGVIVFAGGIVLAGLLRAALSDSTAGLLRVRNRMFDTVSLFAIGVAVLVLGLIVPN